MKNNSMVKIAECNSSGTMHVSQNILQSERVGSVLKKVPRDLYGSGSGIFLMVKDADVWKAVDVINKAGYGRSLFVTIS